MSGHKFGAGMADKWHDATDADAPTHTLETYATFLGGVSGNGEYPDTEDGDLRRAGAVTFFVQDAQPGTVVQDKWGAPNRTWSDCPGPGLRGQEDAGAKSKNVLLQIVAWMPLVQANASVPDGCLFEAGSDERGTFVGIKDGKLRVTAGDGGDDNVTESARTHSHFPLSAGSNPGTFRLYHFRLCQLTCTSVLKSVSGMF